MAPIINYSMVRRRVSKHDHVSKFQGPSTAGSDARFHGVPPSASRPSTASLPFPKSRKTSNTDRNGKIRRSEPSLREEKPYSAKGAVGDVDRNAGSPVSSAPAPSVTTPAFSRCKRCVSYQSSRPVNMSSTIDLLPCSDGLGLIQRAISSLVPARCQATTESIELFSGTTTPSSTTSVQKNSETTSTP